MPIDAATRAANTLRLIERKPSSVIFTKPRVVNGDGSVTPETALPAQVVRVNASNTARVIGGEAGLNPKRAVMVYGIAGVNDIDEGYTFLIDGELYRVEHVIPGTPGVIQAQAALT